MIEKTTATDYTIAKTIPAAMEHTIINVSGDPGNSAFLIKGTKNILYDAGMAFGAPQLIKNIRRHLGDEPLYAVLLSHSHYDHIAGLPFLRKEWPDLVSYGSGYAKKVLEKQTALDTIRRLSGDAARGAGLDSVPDYEDGDLKVDIPLKDGDVLELGNHRIQVYETPGHTRCSLSFLLDEDVLFCSETVGVFTKKTYMPCYLVGYQSSLDAIKKLRKAPAKRIFITHRGILEETDLDAVWDYLEDQMKRTKEEIVDMIRTFPTEEERCHAMLLKYHDGVSADTQPDFAFLLNAAATIKLIEKECMEDLQ